MSKSLLIGAVRRALKQITPDAANTVVNQILSTIKSELISQGSFTLHEIGSLRLEHKPPRQGRNPASGEVITIPAKTVVRYRASSILMDSIDESQKSKASRTARK